MPNAANRWHDNAAGAWYVDDQCIDCDLCNEIAPKNFKGNDAEGHSFVTKQPEGPAEIEEALEAKKSCPVDAIGDDG